MPEPGYVYDPASERSCLIDETRLVFCSAPAMSDHMQGLLPDHVSLDGLDSESIPSLRFHRFLVRATTYVSKIGHCDCSSRNHQGNRNSQIRALRALISHRPLSRDVVPLYKLYPIDCQYLLPRDKTSWTNIHVLILSLAPATCA